MPASPSVGCDELGDAGEDQRLDEIVAFLVRHGFEIDQHRHELVAVDGTYVEVQRLALGPDRGDLDLGRKPGNARAD